MMNGPEKSDSAILAMKPANKAGAPAAEWAERRAGTKGNAGHRTRDGLRAAVACHRGLGPCTGRCAQRCSPSSPKVGAECANRACSDLSGGRPVMGVPTANWVFSSRRRPCNSRENDVNNDDAASTRPRRWQMVRVLRRSTLDSTLLPRLEDVDSSRALPGDAGLERGISLAGVGQ